MQLKSSPEPLLDGELFNDISKDDSSWTIRSSDEHSRLSCRNDNTLEDDVMTFELEKVS